MLNGHNMKKSDPWSKLSHFCQTICIFGAVFALLWCYLEYIKNEDVVEVSFKKYGKDEDSIYPDISLCFDHPYYEEKLKIYDTTLTKSLYTTYLIGQDFFGKWDEKILNINYNNVSLQLNEHLIGKPLLFPAKSATNSYNNITLNNFTTVGYPVIRCFTFHLPSNMKILSFSLGIRNSIFSAGIRPKSGFNVAIHYPQQMVRSWQFFVRNWPVRTNMSARSYQMDINVKDVEILKHRNKPKSPCSDSISYDNDTFKEIIQSVGCNPPYMNLTMDKHLNFCKTKNDLQRIANQVFEAFAGAGKYEKVIPPCKEIQRVGVDVKDTDIQSDKISKGEDVDIDLVIPFIIESWITNG